MRKRARRGQLLQPRAAEGVAIGAHILIIEDNAANLELMRYLLDAFGHWPFHACTAADGVALAREGVPDLILCDVQLPDADGYQVLRQLRSHGATARIPVIAVTALAMVGDRERALSAGFDAYIAKPIDPVVFVAQIEKLLPPELKGVPPERHGRAEDAPAPHARGGQRTLLALDNVPENLDLLAQLFGTLGYRVVTATTMKEALRLARETSPDVIISDVHMPAANGYDFIAEVKADPGLAAIPFVFLSSSAHSVEARERGLACGASKFVFRPVEPDRLAAIIAECIVSKED